MDELMEIPLDGDANEHEDGEEDEHDGLGSGRRVFAASHACACNPMKKAHYPAHWYRHPLLLIPTFPFLSFPCPR